MTRLVVLDTETTGLHALAGDRIIEIGVVELIDRKPTGREFHSCCCPDGAMIEADALQCHGIAPETLIDAPSFASIAPALLDFLGDGAIVAHRAAFDRSFLDTELERAGLPAIPPRALDLYEAHGERGAANLGQQPQQPLPALGRGSELP